ncbi:LacI family DNA-binding transcriptional regulator [Pseudonocardia nigra]|uniref:LacI family DNA-binding transcriptional regulator n=1 Tax=Pseudonocardia nigra TaxID=1921578 RepID=UPI001C603B70|nr:LacI family DNA-binding transcriptional regulator [Pseudonocardia nigra]
MARREGRQKAPTIKVVAAAAGVSTSTVSRVFSRPHLLKESTVAHVTEIATRLGYVPHHAARALSTGRLGMIAVVVPDIANPFFPPVIRAAQAHAFAGGFSTVLGDTDEDPAKELDLLVKLEQRTDGVVLVSSRLPEQAVRERAERGPLVLVNRDVAGVPRILVDSAPGMREAVDHLAALGHRHLAYVSGPASSWSDEQRRRAVQERCAALGVTTTVLRPHRPDHDEGRAAAAEILAAGATAAIAFDDALAQGALAGMAERGVAVPGEVSIVGCDDILAVRTYPPLTTVHGRTAEAGRLAVDLLLEFVEDHDGDRDRRHLLPSSLVLRATTGRAP